MNETINRLRRNLNKKLLIAATIALFLLVSVNAEVEKEIKIIVRDTDGYKIDKEINFEVLYRGQQEEIGVIPALKHNHTVVVPHSGLYTVVVWSNISYLVDDTVCLWEDLSKPYIGEGVVGVDENGIYVINQVHGSAGDHCSEVEKRYNYYPLTVVRTHVKPGESDTARVALETDPHTLGDYANSTGWVIEVLREHGHKTIFDVSEGVSEAVLGESLKDTFTPTSLTNILKTDFAANIIVTSGRIALDPYTSLDDLTKPEAVVELVGTPLLSAGIYSIGVTGLPMVVVPVVVGKVAANQISEGRRCADAETDDIDVLVHDATDIEDAPLYGKVSNRPVTIVNHATELKDVKVEDYYFNPFSEPPIHSNTAEIAYRESPETLDTRCYSTANDIQEECNTHFRENAYITYLTDIGSHTSYCLRTQQINKVNNTTPIINWVFPQKTRVYPGEENSFFARVLDDTRVDHVWLHKDGGTTVEMTKESGTPSPTDSFYYTTYTAPQTAGVYQYYITAVDRDGHTATDNNDGFYYQVEVVGDAGTGGDAGGNKEQARDINNQLGNTRTGYTLGDNPGQTPETNKVYSIRQPKATRDANTNYTVDDVDYYSFNASKGQQITIHVEGDNQLTTILNKGDQLLAKKTLTQGQGWSHTLKADTTGRYYLVTSSTQENQYNFTVTVTGTPDPIGDQQEGGEEEQHNTADPESEVEEINSGQQNATIIEIGDQSVELGAVLEVSYDDNIYLPCNGQDSNKYLALNKVRFNYDPTYVNDVKSCIRKGGIGEHSGQNCCYDPGSEKVGRCNPIGDGQYECMDVFYVAAGNLQNNEEYRIWIHKGSSGNSNIIPIEMPDKVQSQIIEVEVDRDMSPRITDIIGSTTGYNKIELTVRATDENNNLFRAVFYGNDSSEFELYDGIGDGGNTRFNLTLDTTGYTDGDQIEYYARVFDSSGNYVESERITVKVKNDEEPPKIGELVLLPAGGRVSNNTVSGTIEVSALIADNESGVKEITWRDTQSGQSWSTQSFTWTPNGDGTRTLELTVTDDVGNTANKSYEVTVDNSEPSIQDTNPGSNTVAEGVLDLNTTAADQYSSVSRIAWSLVGNGSKTLLGTGSYTVWDSRYYEGLVTLEVNVTDAVGNTRTQEIQVYLNNTVLADLTVTGDDIKLEPTVGLQEVALGQTINVTAAVHNTGYDTASNFTVDYYILSTESTTTTTIPEHHGSSTYGTCLADMDCITSGCNNEVCQSRREKPPISSCVHDPPYPSELGYTCGCLKGACQWKPPNTREKDARNTPTVTCSNLIERKTLDLGPQNTQESMIQWTPQDTGEYSIQVLVDMPSPCDPIPMGLGIRRDRIIESNETNNRAVIEVTVKQAGSCGGADSNQDGVVSTQELVAYIERWSHDEVSNIELIKAINEWLGGCTTTRSGRQYSVDAVRSIPDTLPGSEAVIQIQVDVDEQDKPAAYVVTERVPDGWTITDTGGSLVYDQGSNTLKWLVSEFNGGVGDDTLKYTAKAPENEAGLQKEFRGVVDTIGGTQDTGGDTRASKGTGCTGSTPPNGWWDWLVSKATQCLETTVSVSKLTVEKSQTLTLEDTTVTISERPPYREPGKGVVIMPIETDPSITLDDGAVLELKNSTITWEVY